MLRVVNLRNYKLYPNEVLIKVDRSSVLGNPFFMKEESQRNKVCDEYETYFQKQVVENPKFLNELKRIAVIAREKDIALACWCFPKRCHAEVIKKYVDDWR